MSIRRDCVNEKKFIVEQRARRFFERLISKKRDNNSSESQVTIGPIAADYLIRFQDPITRPSLAGKEISKTLFTARILTLRSWYEHFVKQESFNSSNIFIELEKLLTNFDEDRHHLRILKLINLLLRLKKYHFRA